MEDRRVVLLLPGQGAQHERMAAGLYGEQPDFTIRMSSLFAELGDDGRRLREQWLRTAPNPDLDGAETAQPLLLLVGYALGRALSDLGRPPDVLLGHSVGELASACLAGIFPVADVARSVITRTRETAGVGSGGMLAVAATPEQVSALLPDAVVVAAVNGPRQIVLSGPASALTAVHRQLAAAGFVARMLRSRHAFHSPAMSPVAARFEHQLRGLRARPPQIVVHSSRTATTVDDRQSGDPRFWADQLVLPVRYWSALRVLLDGQGVEPGLLLIDASVDRGLSVAARRHPAVRSGTSRILPLLGPPAETGGPADARSFAAAVAAIRASA